MADLESKKDELEKLKKQKADLEKDVVGHRAVLQSLMQKLKDEYNLSSLEDAKAEVVRLNSDATQLEEKMEKEALSISTELSQVEALLRG